MIYTVFQIVCKYTKKETITSLFYKKNIETLKTLPFLNVYD